MDLSLSASKPPAGPPKVANCLHSLGHFSFRTEGFRAGSSVAWAEPEQADRMIWRPRLSRPERGAARDGTPALGASTKGWWVPAGSAERSASTMQRRAAFAATRRLPTAPRQLPARHRRTPGIPLVQARRCAIAPAPSGSAMPSSGGNRGTGAGPPRAPPLASRTFGSFRGDARTSTPEPRERQRRNLASAGGRSSAPAGPGEGQS